MASPQETRPPGPPPSASADASHWLTKLDRDHPLVGKIWSVREARFTDQPSVLRALGDASFVLLGEKHDNPDHHRLQASALAALVARGKKPVVAWEMLELPAQARLDAYRAQPGATAENLGPALSWESSSWPPWPEYLPIAEVAFEAQLRMVAANLPQSVARSLVHEGASALGPQDAQRLGLDHPFPGDLETSLRDELRASHCGHLPETMIAPMALAQHARDAQMAKSMTDAASAQGVVLIAGAGHVRVDRGVPFYLALGGRDARVISIALIEVETGETSPPSYARQFGAASLPFDFVWFTPRKSDEDPCARFKK